MNELEMLNSIVKSDWIAVRTMVTPRRPEILLDAVFITDGGEVRLTGKAHSVRGGRGEAFSLAIFEHVRSGWWAEGVGGQTTWEPRELSSEWPAEFWKLISAGPRKPQFYSDPELRKRIVPAKCLLDDCAAMELSGKSESNRIVIAASRGLPCTIEVGSTDEACEALLAGLKRMDLGAG